MVHADKRIKAREALPRFSSPISFEKYHIFKVVITALLVLQIAAQVDEGLLKERQLDDRGCIRNFNSSFDYFPYKIKSDVAEDFEVVYAKHYKFVKIDRTGERFVLYQCGSPKPDLADAKGIKFFEIPVTKMAVQQTVSLTFLELLGLRGRISLMDVTYVNSPCTLKLAESGDIKPYESFNKTIRDEQLSEVDLVFGGNRMDEHPKIVSQVVTQDPGLLHRAEWIKYFSLFFNLEKEAQLLFNATVDRYNCQKEIASKLSSKPNVAWVVFNSWKSDYQWTVKHQTAYINQLVTDAGGTLLPSPSHDFNSSQEIVEYLKDVDIVIDETYRSDKPELFYQNFEISDPEQFKFVSNENIWQLDMLLNENGGSDWFESGIAEPDIVLEDLMQILNPADFPNHRRTWFRNIFKESSVVATSEDCVGDPRSAREHAADACGETGTTETDEKTETTGATKETVESSSHNNGTSALVTNLVNVFLLGIMFFGFFHDSCM